MDSERPIFVVMLGRLPEEENYDVRFAKTGREAASTFLEGPPDLVLSASICSVKSDGKRGISSKHAPVGLSWSAERGDARNTIPGEVKVVLRKGVSIGGVIQDARGQPLPNVRVGLFGSSYS
jgi:hypothetical protein